MKNGVITYWKWKFHYTLYIRMVIPLMKKALCLFILAYLFPLLLKLTNMP